MYEEVLSQLAIAQGCMERIRDNLPLSEVVTKGKAMSKAIRLINQLNVTLDLERGGEVAANLRALYVYMLARLTLANASHDGGDRRRSDGAGAQDQERLGPDRHGEAMSRDEAVAALATRAGAVAAIDRGSGRGEVHEVLRLDAERLRLLKSARHATNP